MIKIKAVELTRKIRNPDRISHHFISAIGNDSVFK